MVTTTTTTTTSGILLQELSESIPTTTTTTIPSKDKGKGIMVEEPLKMKKKDQNSTRLLMLAREKDEANVALIEEWNDIQAKIETDYELAQRLQAEEQEELTVDEKATLFQQLLEKRRKHFAAKRAEEKRNRPPTRAQQRSIMCTYLKNMAGWKPKDLKSKSFANIQNLFDKAFKRVNTFVNNFRTVVWWKALKWKKVPRKQKVLDLEHTKTTQALEIDNLKRRIKKLEKKQRSRTHGLRRLYKVGLSARVISSEDEGLGEEDASKQGRKIHDIDADEDITIENVHDEDMFDTCVFNDEEVFSGQDMTEKEVSTADPVTTAGEVVTTANVKVSTVSPTAATITTVELTLAQTLAELKSARPKTKGVVIQEPSETITTTTTIPSKDKGKAQFDEEERITREKEEANAALIAQWNDIWLWLQAKEQEELTIKEKSKLFQQLLEKRRKHFAAKRAEERRNGPPTKAQQRSIMTTYLKNMTG
ncbi:hypothetical protein Tco_1244088 [Tanacetum coccineum]